MTKQREQSLDLIRALCTFGIVLFHYSFNYIEYGISGNHLNFSKYPNGDWGGLFVAMFFMLSGAALWINYGEKINVGKFYIKRWFSIFPMFYLAWFIAYLAKVRELGTWLWGGPRKNLIWTILGVDGYFLNPGVNINYYCLGEWFLGAILILYLLFPLLRILFQKPVTRWITTVILFTAYTINLYMDLFQISDGKNLITCLMDFWIGMLIIEYRKLLKNKKVPIIALMLAVFVMAAPIPIKEVMCSTITGTLWFLILLNIADGVMYHKGTVKAVRLIGDASFGIFLVHHVILYAFMKQYQGTEIGMTKSIIYFIGLFLFILLIGYILSKWGALVQKIAYKFLFSKTAEKNSQK